MESVKNRNNEDFFSGKIAAKEKQKLKARREKNRTVWFGLGMMGIVGWSVAVPSLLGAALGLWLDKKYNHGPLLVLEILRVIIGVLLIGFWVDRLFSTTVAILIVVPFVVLVLVLFSKRIQNMYLSFRSIDNALGTSDTSQY